MKTKIMSLVLVWSIGLMGTNIAFATHDNDNLPDADSPFWNVMADMTSPDDSDCGTLATAALTSAGVPDAAAQAVTMCAGIAMVKTGMQSGMSEDGVTTNLFSAPDWHHISGLYFEHSKGKIEFTEEVDFMSRNFMIFMEEFRTRMEMNKDEIALDADIVTALKNNAAILTMYNVSDFDLPVILVDGDEDEGGVVSGLVYDPASDTITFNAAHFTTFKAVDESDLDKPRIDKVKAYKYKNKSGKDEIKLVINGKKFKSSSDVTLGGKDAKKVTKKSSKKLVANFSLQKMQEKASKTGKNKFKVRVINSDYAQKEYSKKVNLDELIVE